MFYRNTGVIASLSVYNNCSLQVTSTNCPTVRYRDGSFCRRCPGCTRSLSIRSNSILDKQHLDFKQFIWLLHAFSNKNNSYVNISLKQQLCQHSRVYWIVRSHCFNLGWKTKGIVCRTPVPKSSGTWWTVVVEVDKSKFGKRKYNRGILCCISSSQTCFFLDPLRGFRRDGNWVLGLVERGISNRCFFIQ